MIGMATLVASIPQRKKNAVKRAIAFSRRVTSQPHMVPDFLVIGAQKAGTSSLLNYLQQHGSYLRPLLKDTYFFDRHFRRGLDWYLSFYPSLAAKAAAEKRVGGPVVTGEAATHYMSDPWSPARVHATFGDIKLLVLLRDPAQRALSHYHHNVRGRLEMATTALDAFRREPERIAADRRRMEADPNFYSRNYATYSYLARGHYAEHLRRWLDYFPRERLLIVCSERFFTATDAEFRRICRFIGIADRSLDIYPVAGRRNTDRVDERALDYARDHFRQHNQALFDLLQERYDWLH